jgi:hypothetical protein
MHKTHTQSAQITLRYANVGNNSSKGYWCAYTHTLLYMCVHAYANVHCVYMHTLMYTRKEVATAVCLLPLCRDDVCTLTIMKTDGRVDGSMV